MNTPTIEADYLAWHVDGIMAHEFGMEPGAYYKSVFSVMLASESAGKEILPPPPESPLPNYGYLLLKLAHHLALAIRLDAAGQTSEAFLEVIEAHECLTPAALAIFVMKHIKSPDMEKVQNARHSKTRAVEAYAVELYRSGRYASPHEASKKLKNDVLSKASEMGRPLSEDRAQKTIHEWLLKATRGEH